MNLYSSPPSAVATTDAIAPTTATATTTTTSPSSPTALSYLPGLAYGQTQINHHPPPPPPPPPPPQQQHQQPQPSHHQSQSQSHSHSHTLSHSSRARSSSTSSSLLGRSASLRDTIPDPSKPHKRATPPPSRRRSSAAGFAVDGFGFSGREPTGNLNRWSHSTAASTSKSPPQQQPPPPPPQYHQDERRPSRGHTPSASTSRHNVSSSFNTPLLPAFNGTAPNPSSPSYTTSTSPSRNRNNSLPFNASPESSPHRRPHPRSPVYKPSSSSVTAPPPQLPTLALLPATVYDPSSPNGSSRNSPSAVTSNASSDYFNSKPRAPPPNPQRPPSRTQAERVIGRSPLGTPPIGVLEAEARYQRSGTGNRPPPTSSKEPAKPVHGAAHERSRSHQQESKGRSESSGSASARPDDAYQGTPPRSREKRERDKKTMLSRALQKANTAVLLDNAQNFEGAMEAYNDACKLLQQVMIRSQGEEDRRKLDSIRVTYTNRIEELRRLDPGYQAGSGKSLPARPMSNDSLDEQRSMLFDAADDDEEEPAIVQTASMARIVNDRSHEADVAGDEGESSSQLLPLRMEQTGGVRESVISTAIRDVQKGMPTTPNFLLQPPPGKLGGPNPPIGGAGLESPMDRSYMPPPLSPRRPTPPLSSAAEHDEPETSMPTSFLQPDRPPSSAKHQRGNSSESISWLDTIDESGGSSCSSSIHSLSPGGMRRKHIRNASGATEAEFDAALDAAVEAAYDEGYEPYDDEHSTLSGDTASRLKNVEMAKERVREAEREEAIAAAKYRYKESQLRSEALPHVRESAEFNFQEEADEEERLLDEITREYMLDGFDFDLQNKSSLPRQSDSSNFSGSTYNSSSSSHRTTGGTSLSTVAEFVPPLKHQAPSHAPPPLPPPTGALPSVAEAQALQLSRSPPAAGPTFGKEASSVKNRRISVLNANNLKIETAIPNSTVAPGPHTEKLSVSEKEGRSDVPPVPKTAAASTFNGAQADPSFKLPELPQSTRLAAPSPQPPIPSPAETAFTTSPATPALGHGMSNNDSSLAPGSPKTGKTSATGIRKNKSSLSLKQRTLSISSPDGSDASIGTPLSTTFSFTQQRKQSNAAAVPAPTPTPSIPTFNVDGLPSGGMHLFESDIHSPYSPGSPSGGVTNAPIPLEPCPDSYLLRPFWLMRCFYQTIAHPRGGYLSTKLFVPRDVWRVKGVKLKNIDEKISNCDLLTAALQKLSAVDTFDADAVLEEVQALEVVLDQVQLQLAKKLGNEVGSHSVSTLFKDANFGNDSSANGDSSSKGSHGLQDHAPKSAMSQSKSYLTSWRKLRSKGSAVGLSSMATPKTPAVSEVPKDSLIMATLPMTSLPNIRFAKRDISSVTFEGPNASYMSSLARLFDAAQILDQIARQVEDPGLKFSSSTHVGLELSARHAAEFFGFYICRFVLADVTLMLDKFIKRGSEWVLV
ncbi:hypothetical protein BU24DRAFT_465599 [Aaosphaeria arxii CBS 175.79]|uniref:MIT domain-containing protein n=1 Tax=Aaosphaeria arxii CBS 175.79 TaxID=1450172 RepID=A0A6A5XGP4_9PLEO|nr:uncharacterized protein BU24DRAFT_465599 [Aaosphaeria arxii CBS 175.79]KAF2012029.1 hypothetical protein BU24DRAFT_465599 [Aaosphaeria arxii CBS 175.79]